MGKKHQRRVYSLVSDLFAFPSSASLLTRNWVKFDLLSSCLTAMKWISEVDFDEDGDDELDCEDYVN